MKFPTTSHRRTLASALERALQQAASIKGIATNNLARMSTGPITAGGILSLADNLRGAAAQMVDGFDLESPEQIKRLVDHAEAQLGVAGIEQSFREMLEAIRTAAGAALAVLPMNAEGYLLIEAMDAQGNRRERMFGTAETADLQAALTALIATID